MNRFLLASSAILSSILFVALFVASSVSAQDIKPFRTVSGVYQQSPGGEKHNPGTDWYNYALKTQDEKYRPQIDSSFKKALDTGHWGVVQYESQSDGKPYGFYEVFWSEQKCSGTSLRYTGGDAGIYDLYIKDGNDRSCRFHIIRSDGVRYLDLSSSIQVSLDLGINKRGLLLFSGEYTLDSILQGRDIQLPQTYKPRKPIRLPLFISQTKATSGKANAGDVIGQIDPDAYKKVNGTDVLPDLYDLRLLKKGDNGLEPLESEMPHLGPAINRWRDVPYGKYRFMAHAFFNPQVSDQYHVFTSTVDIIVDEKGFTLVYDSDKQKSCFFRKGASDAGLWDLNRRDPNNGSWSSPGAAPERCLDRQLWDTDKLTEEIAPEYDFDKLQPCNVLDLACHLSRFFNSIVGWFMDAISFLFVPDGATVQNMFSGFMKRFNDSLGFLAFPFTFLGDLYNSIRSMSQGSNTCALPSFAVFGAQTQLHLCAWRYQLPAVWSFMQLIIQGGIAIGFLWSVYRIVMRMFGSSVDDHDDDSDGELQEVRWRDDRTGQTGDWERRRK